MSGNNAAHSTLPHGPWIWAASAAVGMLAGAGLSRIILPQSTADGAPIATLLMVAPFIALLACIAVMPLTAKDFWHRRFPEIALGLGGLVAGYYLAAFTARHGPGMTFGQELVLHAAHEFYSFIALVGGLYIVSGTILIEVKGRATPLVNTLLLAIGAILANLVGTTGASVLLIRPLIRLNHGRMRPIHVVLFIFIVSNCGGCLLPIGDPPLYLGYLKGIPFFWTLQQLWPDWLSTVLPLLAVFFVLDTVLARRAAPPSIPETPEPLRLSIHGFRGIVCLALMLVGIFLDPLLDKLAGISGIPFGATLQVLVAIAAYKLAPKKILESNEFSFFPVQEVGLLFAGIFLTMIPALGYLAANGSKLGLNSATSYYYGTGFLSAALDNAPTYLNFLQVALAPNEPSPAVLHAYIATPEGLAHLRAISTGAVFFGAMTYIGNGPNFMVQSIATASGIRMPSFFAYLAYATLILLPILAFHWAVFIR